MKSIGILEYVSAIKQRYRRKQGHTLGNATDPPGRALPWRPLGQVYYTPPFITPGSDPCSCLMDKCMTEVADRLEMNHSSSWPFGGNAFTYLFIRFFDKYNYMYLSCTP